MRLKHDILVMLSWTVPVLLMHPCVLTLDTNNTMDIDQFIMNYFKEVERTLNPDLDEHVMRKRSTNMDVFELQGVDLLVGFQEELSLPVKFPNDLILFSHCPSGVSDEQILYASALEANRNEPNVSPANDLVLYKYQEGVWREKDRVGVVGGVRLAAERIGHNTYIVVAEYNAVMDRGSPIMYLVDYDTDTLQFKQMLDNHLASDVIIWKWEDMEAFAAVAVSENVGDSNKRYSTLSPVYRWEGGSHWNMIELLPTSNPRALAQFTIGSSMFIAVANFQNDLGETVVDSEIFLFDLPNNQISLYQKLPTEAALDIKYFCYQGSRVTDRFLVYASAFHTDEEGRIDYNSVSVVYKLSDEGYFVPFQALRVSRITSWQPVRCVKDNRESLILLAVLEEGIASFQYDGWRFVSTGVTYDRTSFGLGSKRINVLYLHDETLISVANKESSGYETNVFRPVLKRELGVEKVQQEFVAWEQRTRQQLATLGAKMASVLQTARSAPCVNDKVINLGSKVTFVSAEIDQIETYKTKVGEDDVNSQVRYDLLSLSSKLETVQRELKTIKSKVHQPTFPDLTLYQDIQEPEANIQCVHACRVDELQVTNMNGENFPQFLANTVNIRGLVEFERDVVFDNLALTDPLKADKINNHPSDTVVDWSQQVYLENGLKVEGDITVLNNLSVGGLLDGVAINMKSRLETPETVVSPANYYESLNVSQLTLLDGKLSGVDFAHFKKATLKTQGDQIFTEFQDFEAVEADEVVASGGVSRVSDDIPSPPTHLPCGGKPCKYTKDPSYDSILEATAAGSDNTVVAINYIDNEITITSDFTIYGSVSIQNGTLVADDLVDLKHNISANRLMESAIPLDQAVVNNHFNFHSGFEAKNVNVDSLNGVNVSSLRVVDQASTEPLVVTARKDFRGGFTVQGTMDVAGFVNGVNISQFLETLSESSEVQFNNLTLHSITSSDVAVGGSDWRSLVWKNDDGVVLLDDLRIEGTATVHSLQLQGPINGLNLEAILQDTVFSDGKPYVITGKKQFTNGLNISKITLSKTLNAFDLSNITADTFWKERLSQAGSVKVDNLLYTGHIDGIEAKEFGEWMMVEGDQTVMGYQTVGQLTAVNMVVKTVNSIDIQKLMTEAVFTYDNATLDHAKFEKTVEVPGLQVGQRLQSLHIPEDLLLSDGDLSPEVSGVKRVHGNITVHGGLHPKSLSSMCHALASNGSHIAITGNASFKKEPNISKSVNNQTWMELLENVWFKESDISLTKPIHLYTAEMGNLEVENINNNNVNISLSELVSLSRDESINGTFFFSSVEMAQGLEGEEATVGGRVQGLLLQSFVDNVMLDGVDQEVTGIPDFNHLIVDGVLEADGMVNSLNLSKDVMLNSVANNTMTAPLTLTSMTVKRLSVPLGSMVAGVDVLQWNRTVVRRAGRAVVTGDLVFKGQFDAAGGVRVEGLVNGMLFDEHHVMRLGSAQQISGVKTFSPRSHLTIGNLTVRGFLNGINVSDFYSQLVPTSGNITIYGPKRFSMPLYSEKAVLPEVYQGHNLSLLESQLSFPPSWDGYEDQLSAVQATSRLAQLSLAGRAYYMTNISRLQEIEGTILLAFPLGNLSSPLLGTITRDGSKTMFSLLHWSDQYNMFLRKPESAVYMLKEAPVDIQPVALPGGDMAVYLTRYSPNSNADTVKYGEMLLLQGGQPQLSNILDGRPNSRLLAFRHSSNRTCFVVVADLCRVYCPLTESRRIRLPSFSCQNTTEMSVLVTASDVYLVGLQSDSLVIWKLQDKRFAELSSEPQFHAVSVATNRVGSPVIAVANRHRVGYSRPETIDLYRLNETTGRLSLRQQLRTIAPKQIVFDTLPSKESVLYVLSDNPATPLEVFVYRGVLGYQSLVVETTLPRPTAISTFTDHQQRHFALINYEGRAQVFQTQFKGR